MAVPSVAKWMLNPLIVLNMGSEMVYILQQRLKAQKIATDKACRVLMDTVSALFELKMIESTFRAQATFSSPSVRELFHRITHCSIMRLNDESMDKLYDLMMMGLKVQLIRSRDSYELIESTLHRIDNIHSIIDSKCASCSEHSNLLGVIQCVRRRVIRTYFESISSSKLLVVRKRLFQWVQDRKIKVSILLQKKLQSMDGHIITNSVGMLPKYTQIPGRQYRITLQDLKQNNIRLNEHSLILPNSKCCYPNNIRYSLQCHRLHTEIGQNLYRSNTASDRQQNKKSQPISTPNDQHHDDPQQRVSAKQRTKISKALQNTLDGLSSIINDHENEKQNENGNDGKQSVISSHSKHHQVIKLDLFEFEIDDDINDGDGQNKKENLNGKHNEKRFGRKESALNDALKNMDIGDDQTAEDSEEDDLLDLIDGDDS